MPTEGRPTRRFDESGGGSIHSRFGAFRGENFNFESVWCVVLPVLQCTSTGTTGSIPVPTETFLQFCVDLKNRIPFDKTHSDSIACEDRVNGCKIDFSRVVC